MINLDTINFIKEKLEEGKLSNIVDLVSDYLGVPHGSQVIIFCSSCNEVFLQQGYREHTKWIAKGKEEGFYERWRYDIFKHWSENKDHDIIAMGHVLGSGLYNFSEGWRKENLSEKKINHDLHILETESKETRT